MLNNFTTHQSIQSLRQDTAQACMEDEDSYDLTRAQRTRVRSAVQSDRADFLSHWLTPIFVARRLRCCTEMTSRCLERLARFHRLPDMFHLFSSNSSKHCQPYSQDRSWIYGQKVCRNLCRVPRHQQILGISFLNSCFRWQLNGNAN